MEQRPQNIKRLAQLQRKIMELDTACIVNKQAPEVMAAIYRYFREGQNSSQVAASLGLHAPWVRQNVKRLIDAAEELGFPRPERIIIQKRKRTC